ncbi:DUF5301 domain-containing protein [Streptococcus ovis]|uniref:DUF5301 domain-containing protein n=1 Tax=Streptococcus ovis TaxID=82806 RepID=UPI00035F5754|nr:DUF5301 domain-containing protein [Streptococcus ovis]
MKKVVSALLLLVVGIVGAIIWWYWPSEVQPVVPKIDEIQEVRVTQPDDTVIPLDMEEKIISFVYFAKDSRKTRQKSVNDQPNKELMATQVELLLKNGSSKMFYIYQDGFFKKTYLEIPYDGIYEMEYSLSDWLSGKLDY